MSQTISALANGMGLRADTLRYYERLGLLHPSERTAAGYRIYDDEAAKRLRFIKDAQHMGPASRRHPRSCSTFGTAVAVLSAIPMYS
jgi:hypothetical protein